MTHTHTKGPWEACHNGQCKCGMVFSNEKIIAQAKGADYPSKEEEEFCAPLPPQDERIKNARLIAAAPTMLEALDEMESVLNIARMISNRHHANTPITDELWSELHQYLNEAHATRRKALAKATGDHQAIGTNHEERAR